MFSDSAEETLTLTMGELRFQMPRTMLQPSLSPSPPPPPLYSLKSSSNCPELVEFPDVAGFDFYSSPFDNSFPYRGVVSNERSFSCSSPTSNTSFLSETSFSNQPVLKNSNDSGIASDNSGLLTTTSTPYRGNDANNLSMDFQRLTNGGGGAHFNNEEPPPHLGEGFMIASQVNQALNDSTLSISSLDGVNGVGSCLTLRLWDSPTKAVTSTPKNMQFDFAFPVSDSSVPGTAVGNGDSGLSSSNGSSNASADSPSRLLAEVTDSGSIPCSFSSQWNSSNVSSLLENQSPESPSSNSIITTTALGNPIWNPPSQVSAAINNPVNGNIGFGSDKNSGNSPRWDETLKGFNKQKLLKFVEILKQNFNEYVDKGEDAIANRIQGIMVSVQNYIISTFVCEPSDSSTSSVHTPTNSIGSQLLPSPTETFFERPLRPQRDFNGPDSKERPYTWTGCLPVSYSRSPTYSCKVFLGGLPWDIQECTLMQTFKMFGIVKIEWPGKDGLSSKPKGYAYAVFDTAKQVKMLLQHCTQDYNYHHNRIGDYFYKISSKKFRGKSVQIIPWDTEDSNFNRCQAAKIDPQKTIFVGALHGMVNAEGLAIIMNDLFGGVVYAGIDTDRTKYPIGSARVTFANTFSYRRAVTAAFVLVQTPRFEKKLQVDPYLEDATCSSCNLQLGPYFCRHNDCFRYFCRTCFHNKHSEGSYTTHEPMTRTTHNKPTPVPPPIFNNWQPASNNGNRGPGAIFGNKYHQQPSYNYASGNSHANHNNTYHPPNGYANGGNNNRHWSNGNNGRNSPQMYYSGGVGQGNMLGFSGDGRGNYPRYNNNNGGYVGGGAGNTINSNGHDHPQLSHTNKFFGPVGHRQQLQQQQQQQQQQQPPQPAPQPVVRW